MSFNLPACGEPMFRRREQLLGIFQHTFGNPKEHSLPGAARVGQLSRDERQLERGRHNGAVLVRAPTRRFPSTPSVRYVERQRPTRDRLGRGHDQRPQRVVVLWVHTRRRRGGVERRQMDSKGVEVCRD